MSSIPVSSITFAFVFGGALLGMSLRAALPEHYLDSDSKDAVKVGMGLVATMAALVLGLLIASAKSSYDTQNNELTDMSSKLVLLDRVLAHYGPESKEARDQLRSSTVRALDQMWAKDRTGLSQLEPSSISSEVLYDKIQALSPSRVGLGGFRQTFLSRGLPCGRKPLGCLGCLFPLVYDKPPQCQKESRIDPS
jgi:hypothetical protein